MSRKSILIVEDDVNIRESLQEVFGGEGYPVLLAEHGQAALDILMTSSTAKPGLILLDLMMPVMDGDTEQLTIKTTGLIRKPFNLEELFKVAARYCV